MAMFIKETPCDICDTVTDVNSFCLNFRQNFCDNCKKGHLRTALTNHHKFVPVGDSLLASNQVTGICSKHQHEHAFYCLTCSKSTCSACLAECHKMHDFYFISTQAAEARSEIEDELSKTETQLADVKTTMLDCDKAISRCKEMSDSNNLHINSTIRGWIEDFRSVEKEMVDRNNKSAKESLERIENYKKKLLHGEQKLTTAINDTKLKLRTSSNVSILDEKPKIVSEIASLSVPAFSDVSENIPKINLCKSSKDEVRNILTGTLIQDNTRKLEADSADTKKSIRKSKKTPVLRENLHVLSRQSLEVTAIYDIAPISKSQAWLGRSSDIALIDIAGNISVRHDLDDWYDGTTVVATTSGDALYVSCKKIYRIDQKGKIRVFINGPICVKCMTSSEYNDDVYVSTAECLMIFSCDGKLIKSVTFQNAGPCVILTDGNIITMAGHEISYVRKDGSSKSLKTTAFSQADFCRCLTSDSNDNLIVASFYKNEITVHVYTLIRRNRIQLQKCHTLDVDYILSVKVKQNRLWIGTYSGNLLVVEYLET